MAAPRNWARRDKSWHPIDELPAKTPAALLFANADLTKQWLVERPKGAPDGKDRVHKRDEDGQFQFDGDEPVIEDAVHEAAFFAFVTLEGDG